MPIELKYTDNELGFMMHGSGMVTSKEVFDSIDERFSSPTKTKNYVYGYDDFSNIKSLKISLDDINVFLSKNLHASKFNNNLIFAFVAPRNLEYGLCRMFEMRADVTGWSIQVFREANVAKKWVQDLVRNRYGYEITMG